MAQWFRFVFLFFPKSQRRYRGYIHMLAVSSLKWLSCSTMTFLGWSVWSHPCFFGEKGRCSPWSWKPVRNHTILPGKVSQPSWEHVPYIDSILLETPLQKSTKITTKSWSWHTFCGIKFDPEKKRVPFAAYHQCTQLEVSSSCELSWCIARLSAYPARLRPWIFTWNKPAGDIHNIFLASCLVGSKNMDEGHLIWMYMVYIY